MFLQCHVFSTDFSQKRTWLQSSFNAFYAGIIKISWRFRGMEAEPGQILDASPAFPKAVMRSARDESNSCRLCWSEE
jgi:hypothetical protein